jgi:primosomal protein N' (replication factor Y)
MTEEVLKNDKQVILLVPEIMLTSQLVARFEQYFGIEIALMHSGLSKSQKFTSYKNFSNGEKRILIGPRSALLVPSNSLGLIIIDEEQEDAYKQERNPRYHAVDLAEKITAELGAMLLLGSATPRIESYYKTTKCHPEAKPKDLGRKPHASLEPVSSLSRDSSPRRGGAQNDISNRYNLFELKNRYHKMILPPCEIVDLKNEIKYKNFSSISIRLQAEIERVLQAKKQAILFINRRGAATFISCRDCGCVILCPNCSIPLVYHLQKNSNFLNCHHCDFRSSVPRICPSCESTRIKFFGSGIEKIELEVEKLFPKAKIRRVDSKSLENKGAYEQLYKDLKERKIDLLIGTQIVAKGLDLPEVDLVGVISADTGLHLPYFRANEKTFQILTQVSGRSGRKNNAGKTIIQTYWPESRAIKFAALHDYEGFFNEEIKDRQESNYPPFSHIIRIISEDPNQTRAKNELKKIADLLNSTIERMELIGPAPCFLSRINNKFRYHIVMKTDSWPNDRIREVFLKNPYLIWDVDPTDLL